MVRCGCCVGYLDNFSDGLKLYNAFPTFQCMYNNPNNMIDVYNSLNIIKCSNQNIYVHCALNINPVKPNLSAVKAQCDMIKNIPCSAVLHMGNCKYGGTMEMVSQNINKLNLSHGIFETNKYVLLMENSAGQGNDLGKTWDEIRKLYEGLDKTVIGLCFDTQHAFASGMVSFVDENSVDNMFEQINGICGKPNLIHLNDSKVEFGKHVDRHQNLGMGYIWNKNFNSLKRLKIICEQLNIDMILETPHIYINNDLKIIYEI